MAVFEFAIWTSVIDRLFPNWNRHRSLLVRGRNCESRINQVHFPGRGLVERSAWQRFWIVALITLCMAVGSFTSCRVFPYDDVTNPAATRRPLDAGENAFSSKPVHAGGDSDASKSETWA